MRDQVAGSEMHDCRTEFAEASSGLTSGEAALLLARDGANVLPQPVPVRWWRRVAVQLRDPLILVLLAASALTAATADWTDMSVILLVVVVNTAVGVGQEVRAEHAISALSRLTAPTARVTRDGRQREIPAAQVVVGDVLVLAEGDIVAADATVTEAAALMVDESALTGESVPVDKSAAGDNQLWAGTVVVKGRGLAVVGAIGVASATGRIARLMEHGSGLTLLQRKLIGIGRWLAAVTVVLCVIVLALGLIRGQPVELMVVTAISLAVAAVPESLPAVVTLSMALGARRMAERHALIRRLPAVETLGAVTVLVTDKTGTLTEGHMVVRQLWTPTVEADVTGAGYGPNGEIRVADRVLGTSDLPALTELLTAAALCNDARLSPPAAVAKADGAEAEWTALGDPTEAALLAAAAKLGLHRDDLNVRYRRVGERPFDSDRKRMSTVHRLPSGRYRIICKGAPESILDPAVLADGPVSLGRAIGRADQLAHNGFRVLAIAQADLDRCPRAGADPERGLGLLGLIAIVDPSRPAAADTIAACRRAGIRTVLVTGDHVGTARAIATAVGISRADDTVVDCRAQSGRDLPDAAVYARATPAQKLDIIRTLRSAGQVVAMTGDGVNDAPALRSADIGVAMGRRGTEVARQAADLVLADDDLGTVVAAVEEGRRIYANIRRFLVYGLAGGTAEIAVMLLAPFLGLTLPLLPAQILWINLLTHGLPGVALGGEPGAADLMHLAPRPPAQSILGGGLWQRVLRIAVVLTGVTLAVAVWADHTGRPWQSLAFFTLGATQLGAALGSRARPRSWANPMLLVAVTVALALQAAALYVPFLQELLGTRAPTVTDLLVVGCVSALGYIAVRLDRILHAGPTVTTRVPPA
ncbi:cation-translocating P-type ATPase [Nocardia sp. NPDC059764]|uniref:cation-translocating P-type ATPase n=1 Tax=Nocardia sp. NPDC059764 TaxID=3346939 RepID=UPI0036685B15